MVGLILGTGGNGADLTQVTAAASDVAKDKVIVGPDGQPITGTLDTYDVTEITPKSTAQTINGPIIIPDSLTVKAVQTQSRTVYPQGINQTITPDTNKFFSSMTVKGVKTYVGSAAYVRSYTLNVNPDNIPFEKLFGIEVFVKVEQRALAANMMLAAFLFTASANGLQVDDYLNSVSLERGASTIVSFTEAEVGQLLPQCYNLYISSLIKGGAVYISSANDSVTNKFNSSYEYVCQLHYLD